MTRSLQRSESALDALTGGIPEGQQSEPYAQFFDTIDRIRPLGPEDRVTTELMAVISDSDTSVLRLGDC